MTSTNILLGTPDYNAVRNILGVSVSEVSDDLIESLDYLVFVEGEIKAKVTDWATLTGQNNIRLRMAVVTWIAARLCSYLERSESRSFKLGQYSQNATGLDWRRKAKDLMHESISYLMQITTQTAAGRPTLFTRDGPTRSRTRVPGSAEYEAWLDKIEPTVIDWLEDEQTTT